MSVCARNDTGKVEMSGRDGKWVPALEWTRSRRKRSVEVVTSGWARVDTVVVENERLRSNEQG